MKYFILFIANFLLFSCSEQLKTKKKSKPENEAIISYSKLPEKPTNISLLRQLEFEKFWNPDTKPIGEFFGKELFVYSFEYDTIVNDTPILFLYQFIGGRNKKIVEERMLDDMNGVVNDLIQTAKIESFNCLYSVAYDKIYAGKTIKYARNEQLYTGGAGEFLNQYVYEIDQHSLAVLIENPDYYSSDSRFLNARLVKRTNE